MKRNILLGIIIACTSIGLTYTGNFNQNSYFKAVKAGGMYGALASSGVSMANYFYWSQYRKDQSVCSAYDILGTVGVSAIATVPVSLLVTAASKKNNIKYVKAGGFINGLASGIVINAVMPFYNIFREYNLHY